MKKRHLLFIFIGITVVVLGFFLVENILTTTSPSINSSKLQIATSFYPLYFFTSQITGEKAIVFTITPPGVEPHDYEPTSQDLAKIYQSQILVTNGGTIDQWLDHLKVELKDSKLKRIVTIEENSQTDPHAWLDPVEAKMYVQKILFALQEVDSKNASYYQQNADTLNHTLDELDIQYRNGLTNCQTRTFITQHKAFGHLTKRYNLTENAISGISPDEEPTPTKLAELTNLINKEHLKVIFFERLVNPKIAQTIARETHTKTLVLDPIEGISPRDLQKGVNYFSIMENNLANLQIALECQK